MTKSAPWNETQSTSTAKVIAKIAKRFFAIRNSMRDSTNKFQKQSGILFQVRSLLISRTMETLKRTNRPQRETSAHTATCTVSGAQHSVLVAMILVARTSATISKFAPRKFRLHPGTYATRGNIYGQKPDNSNTARPKSITKRPSHKVSQLGTPQRDTDAHLNCGRVGLGPHLSRVSSITKTNKNIFVQRRIKLRPSIPKPI